MYSPEKKVPAGNVVKSLKLTFDLNSICSPKVWSPVRSVPAAITVLSANESAYTMGRSPVNPIEITIIAIINMGFNTIIKKK